MSLAWQGPWKIGPDDHIRQLVSEGRTGLIKGFKKKDRNGKYDACIVLTNGFSIRPNFGKQMKAAKTA
jgi:hypothetical protein